MKITIFGLAGSGTSTIGKLLCEKLDYRFMSSGNIMRSWAEELGLSIYEFEEKVVKNDDSFDIKLDSHVEKFGLENDNFIFESRLAWNFIPDSYKIFLKCDEGERYNRIQNREGTLLEEIIEKNHKREIGVEKRYAEIYPHISFPPSDDIFDLVIDVTNIPIKNIIEIIKNNIK